MSHTVTTCTKHSIVAVDAESIKGKKITPDIERQLMNDLMLPDDNLVVLFTEAFASFNLVQIQNLLADDGVFEIIRDEKLEAVEVSKAEYLVWFEAVIKDFRYYNENIEKLNFTYDRCWGCSLGGYVTLFHDGKFPVETTGNYQKDKIGLLLKATGNFISEVSFCYQFQHTRNDYNRQQKSKTKIRIG